MLMTFLSLVTNSDERTELKALLAVFPCRQVASVEMKIKFESSNHDVCIFSFNDYIAFAKQLIKIVHLYIIQLYAAYTKYDSVY
jgi:hypothetical protein